MKPELLPVVSWDTCWREPGTPAAVPGGKLRAAGGRARGLGAASGQAWPGLEGRPLAGRTPERGSPSRPLQRPPGALSQACLTRLSRQAPSWHRPGHTSEQRPWNRWPRGARSCRDVRGGHPACGQQDGFRARLVRTKSRVPTAVHAPRSHTTDRGELGNCGPRHRHSGLGPAGCFEPVPSLPVPVTVAGGFILPGTWWGGRPFGGAGASSRDRSAGEGSCVPEQLLREDLLHPQPLTWPRDAQTAAQRPMPSTAPPRPQPQGLPGPGPRPADSGQGSRLGPRTASALSLRGAEKPV